MSYTLSTVALNDIDGLVRYCDYPAMQSNPLNKTMFPNPSRETEEEEITWHVTSFRESFKDPGVCFCKACTNDETPVGFAVWTLDQACVGSKAEAIQIPTSLDVCA